MWWATAWRRQSQQTGQGMVGGLQRSHVDSTHTLTHGMTLAEPPCLICEAGRSAAWLAMTSYNPAHKARRDPMWLPCRASRLLSATRTNLSSHSLPALPALPCSVPACLRRADDQAIARVYGCLCGQHHSPPLSSRWGVEPPSGQDKQARGKPPPRSHHHVPHEVCTGGCDGCDGCAPGRPRNGPDVDRLQPHPDK